MRELAKSCIDVRTLADQLERSFRGGAWHGPAVCEALEDVDYEIAASRPIAGAHTIWEIVDHLTTWIDVADRRTAGETPEVTEARDWPARDAADEAAWERTRAALDAAHRRLHASVEALDDTHLGDPVAGSDPTLRGLLLGILQHNTYHAGQISILARAAASERDS